MTSRINMTALVAANHATGTDPGRPQLMGVYVEVQSRHSIVVGTDGHILFAHRYALPKGAPDNTTLGGWIVHSSVIKTLKLKPVKGAHVIGNLALEAGKITLDVPGGVSVSFAPSDLTYPEWRRIVPHEFKHGEDMEGLDFDPKLRTRLDRAFEGLNKECVTCITTNGARAALVISRGVDGAFGLIMPKRMSCPLVTIAPDWARA